MMRYKQKKVSLIVGCILCFAVPSFSQERRSLLVDYSFSIGVSGQFDVLDGSSEPFGYNGVYSNIHGNGANDEGLGLSLKFQAYSSRLELGFAYEPIIRYDVIKPSSAFYFSGQGNKESVFGWFADHHLSLIHNFKLPTKPKLLRINEGKRNYFGLGLSIMSPGLSYDYDYYIYYYNSQKEERGSQVDISFNGIHALLGFPIYKRFFFEAKFLWVPPGQRMFENYQYSNMLFLKGSYQIQIGKN